MTRQLIALIEGEFQRYKALAEGAMRQATDGELALHTAAGSGEDNSIAVIVQHLAGNFRSRFTDFLTTDGEKPWRDRDREFEERTASRAELLTQWDDGWRVLLGALAALTDADLGRAVVIRGQSFRVDEALLRSLAHASYHAGQIVYIAKAFRGAAWKSLSIPKGQSAAFNAAPTGQRPAEHAAKIGGKDRA